MRNKRLPTAGPRLSGGGNSPRISGSRGGSQVGATPFARVPQGLVGQRIQPALGDILLELSVPGCGVELGEPGAERDQIVVGELADCILDLVDGAHDSSLSLAADRSNGHCRLMPKI